MIICIIGRLLLLHILQLCILTKVLEVVTILGMYLPSTLLGSQAGSQAMLALARSVDSDFATLSSSSRSEDVPTRDFMGKTHDLSKS